MHSRVKGVKIGRRRDGRLGLKMQRKEGHLLWQMQNMNIRSMSSNRYYVLPS